MNIVGCSELHYPLIADVFIRGATMAVAEPAAAGLLADASFMLGQTIR